MASEIKVDTIVNAGGDNDSGIDLATNDVVAVKTANTERMRVDASGNVGIGNTSPDQLLNLGNTSSSQPILQFLSSTSGANTIHFGDGSSADAYRGYINYAHNGDSLQFASGGSERMRINSAGVLLVGKTSSGSTTEGCEMRDGTAGEGFALTATSTGDSVVSINRKTNDGQLVALRQDGTTEGNISVSGGTVSYNGFSGLHESSGIATNTPIGTVVSTIDELDVYSTKQGETGNEEDNPKAGQTRADHAKVKVSDTAGDKAVYGVVGSFNAQGKVNVASVGIGSVRVTGACVKGDLLESNGDGTAKVQSDDIVRSKTIGKVTIGNSNTGVKLVSCVLYCG